jgi:hypothetical protein
MARANENATAQGKRDLNLTIITRCDGAQQSLGNPQPGKSSVAGRRAFIHRQQTLVIADQCPGRADEVLRRHVGLPHFQFWISGRSWPCLSM